MFLTVCLNPTLQKTLRFSSLVSDTVNRTEVHRLDASGKGINVTRVLQQLGKKAVHLTQLGGVLRPLFLSLCEQDFLSVEWVESASTIRFCYTLVNDADSSVTELVEESQAVAAGTEERLLEKFDSLATDNQFLIISGTRAAGFSDALIPSLVKKAKERGLKIILDIRGKDLANSLACGPEIVKPNLYEFATTFAPDLVKGNELQGDENIIRRRIKETALELCEKYNCKIILTRGSRSIWACEADNFFEVDFEPVLPGAGASFNTTGSGDAFTAGLASALSASTLSANAWADGAGFAAAIAEGIRCGGLNARCFRPGAIADAG